MRIPDGRIFKVMFSVVSIYYSVYRQGGSSLYRDPAPPPGIFKLVQLGPHCKETPYSDLFKLYEARMVGKRAVSILLECFLVS